eukprot:CAMPEP_0182492344 /NCGR_PEP_ID=MMETSP1321-20130603/1507_1 /TAXON_ID=91990 /ORGANISM="Bolidomonas sp., Strain RCC1657" /LENGTH=67 /DNA_ID=CAMNT_0024694799 /DNA_START=521 /DNA_END=724 /DNA_ORIENTATION=-
MFNDVHCDSVAELDLEKVVMFVDSWISWSDEGLAAIIVVAYDNLKEEGGREEEGNERHRKSSRTWAV